MSSSDQNSWIVLVNKSPRGPLTKAEVQALLAQGIVRHNDLAYRVNANDPKEKTDWKLLWQFTEFDRRSAENIAKAKAAPPLQEKRANVPATEIQKQSLSEIPDDLLDIAPEDLIPRTRALVSGSVDVKWNEMAVEAAQSELDRRNPSSGARFAIPRWTYAFGSVLLISYIFFRWLAGHTFTHTSMITNAPAPEIETTTDPRHRGTASSGGPPTGERPSRPSRNLNHLSPAAANPLPSERPREQSAADVDAEREKERERDKERDREREGDKEREREEKVEEPESEAAEAKPPGENEDRRPSQEMKKAIRNSSRSANPEENREEESEPRGERFEND